MFQVNHIPYMKALLKLQLSILNRVVTVWSDLSSYLINTIIHSELKKTLLKYHFKIEIKIKQKNPNIHMGTAEKMILSSLQLFCAKAYVSCYPITYPLSRTLPLCYVTTMQSNITIVDFPQVVSLKPTSIQ